MAIDGVLIHHLVNEIKDKILNGRINKIIQSNQTDVILQVHNFKTYNLFISLSYTAPRIYLMSEKPYSPQNPYNFCMVLRKYLERGIIKNIKQIDNDRIIIIDIEGKNELGDTIIYQLIIELMGRSSNLILINEQNKIIEVLKRHFPSSLETARIMIPKATYQYPDKRNMINPFINPQDLKLEDINIIEGLSKQHKQEILYLNSVNDFISQKIVPTIIQVENKRFFSPYDLKSLIGKKESFDSISLMLEKYYAENTKQDNPNYHLLQKLINRKLNILESKLTNLHNDLENAQAHTEDIIKGQLIQTYLYQIKKGMTSISLPSFDGDKIYEITLDPLKSPIDNMQKYFKNYKKSLNGIFHINKQLEITHNEIKYLKTILSQMEFVNQQEFLEIRQELIQNGYLKDDKKAKVKTNSLKSITKYTILDAVFYVGKNNLQNNYLTHNFAKKSDYWFHVKDMPSAHVIVQTTELNERIIRIAAHLAALNSKYEKSSSVAVDYTLVKNIKKIPNTLGCFVTYTNQKTIYIDPSLEDLRKLLENQ